MAHDDRGAWRRMGGMLTPGGDYVPGDDSSDEGADDY